MSLVVPPSHSGPSRMIIDYGQPHARGPIIFSGMRPATDETYTSAPSPAFRIAGSTALVLQTEPR